jgi:hypothetical protein
VPEADKMIVNISENYETAMFMVFKDIKSVLSLVETKKGYASPNVPKNAKIAFIAVQLRDGKPYFARHDNTVAAVDNYKPTYKPCTLTALRKELEVLN